MPGAKCQYPTSGSRENGTLRFCGEPATHYFDFSTYGKDGNGDHIAHRVVCIHHKSDPAGLFHGKKAVLIGETNANL